ncbi:MAG: hypothetical protein AAB359_08600, partial [Elusimicrobiota bacterium]
MAAQIFFDTVPPQGAVTSPDPAKLYYKAFSRTGGTVSDPPGTTPPAAGIYKAWGQLKAVNGVQAGKYWDNATSTFTAAWNQAGNEGVYYIAGSSWDYAVSYPTAAFINGVQYETRFRASDLTYNSGVLEGIQSDLSAANIFNFDVITPTAVVTAVSAGQSRSQVSTASGTISEEMVLANVGQQSGAQIQEVRLHLRYNNINQYWDGSGWSASQAVYAPAAVHQSSWSFGVMPDWADDGSYTLWAEASDKAGNVQVNFSGNGSSVTFTVDETAPAAAVTSVQTSTRVAVLASVSGTANDANPNTNSGIAGSANTQVQISFLLGAVTWYYNNATAFSSALTDANSWWPASSWAPQGPSSGTWTYSPAGLGSTMISDKAYSIRVRTQDNAIPVPNPVVLNDNAAGSYNVVFDTTPPTLGINAPAEAAKLKTIPMISGTANADLAGLKDVRLNVYSFTSGAWQPVSSNNQADGIWFSSWSWTTLSGLVTNTTYQVAARAQDYANNWSAVYSTVTFVYDATPPSVSVGR